MRRRLGDACNRSNVRRSHRSTAAQVDSIGVSITYTYNGITPIVSTLPMADVTVMQFNPTNISG